MKDMRGCGANPVTTNVSTVLQRVYFLENTGIVPLVMSGGMQQPNYSISYSPILEIKLLGLLRLPNTDSTLNIIQMVLASFMIGSEAHLIGL